VFILNVPGTYPAWKVNGEMITGMLSPNLSCFPPELKFFLNKNWIINGKSVRDIFKAFNIKKELFLRKLNEDLDLLVYVIRLPDSLSHHAKVKKSILTDYINIGYRKIDQFIGKILNNKEVENIIIISDHGLKYYNYRFYIKRWLEKRKIIYINNSKNEKLNTLIQKFYNILKFYSIKIPFGHYYKKVLNLKNREVKKLGSPSNKRKDYTRVQNFIGNVGGLFLNSQDKNKFDLIRKSLENEKYVDHIIIPKLDDFPDLFIVLNEKYIFNTKQSYFVKMKMKNTISHDEFGLFIAYGDKIKKGISDHLSYINIAPTLLHLLNIEKPIYMEGEILNIFKSKNNQFPTKY
jgi:predicted AlkP superfamily phosphohydrolase/phosphomutase